MALPTTSRGSTLVSIAPPQDAIVKAMEVSTTPETADYLVEQFIKRMEKLGPEMVMQSQSILDSLIEYRDNIHLLYGDSESAWAGKPVSTDSFQRLQQNAAIKALNTIPAEVKENLIVNFATNENSEFIRGFVGENGLVDDKTAKQIDKLLNDFFASHGYIAHDGVIFNNKNGIDNLTEKANSAEVASLMEDKFASYLKSQGIKDVSVYKRDFPGSAPAVEAEASPSSPGASG